jgi:hypothetical protein
LTPGLADVESMKVSVQEQRRTYRGTEVVEKGFGTLDQIRREGAGRAAKTLSQEMKAPCPIRDGREGMAFRRGTPQLPHDVGGHPHGEVLS